MQYYLVKNNRLIPITSKSQIHVGSIIAVVNKGNAIYFRIDKLLPDKNINNWFKGRANIISLYVLKNPALRPYFLGEGLSGLSNEELSGFFHSIGHIFSSIGHGIKHVVGQVVKHPVLLAIPAAAAAPFVIPAVGSAIGAGTAGATAAGSATVLSPAFYAPEVGYAAGTGAAGAAAAATGATATSSIASILSTAGKVVATNIASQLAGRILSVPPEQVVAQGAQDLGYSPDVANQAYNQSQQYAQQNNMQANLPYQQTAAYVAAHWDYFSQRYRTPEAAVTALLIKRHGIPPGPYDNPDTTLSSVGGGFLDQIKPYIPYIGVGLAILLLIPKHGEKIKT